MRPLLFLLFGVLCFGLKAQDCTLSVATAPVETLEGVFQLNTGQVVMLKNIKEVTNNKLIREQKKVDALLTDHPQDTPEQLAELNGKHEALVNEMAVISKNADIEFLRVLNEKQYKRYTELCFEAVRKPLVLPEQ